MRNEWRRLTFLHWDYDPSLIQKLLPDGLEIETWDDQAWVGLVPFQMHVRSRRGPYLPWISRFPETNLRTYVRGPNDEVGVWFFSLEAARLPAVVIGRVGYGVWYHWASMSIADVGAETVYRSRRLMSRHPNGLRLHVRHGDTIQPNDLTPFEHYLTARWSLFGLRAKRLTFARASHEPWPLRRAEVVSWSSDLFAPANIPDPSGEPIVLTSPGVSVAIGPREFLA